MVAITTEFGSGGSNLSPNLSVGEPDLATALREIADDIAAVGMALAPLWTTGITVTSHEAVLATAGYVVAVEATAGSTTGPVSQVQDGSPATTEVNVVYAVSGVATLTFATGDAVTACAVVILPKGADYTIKTTKG